MNHVPQVGSMTTGFDAFAKNDYATARIEFEREVMAGDKRSLIHFGWLLEQGLGGQKDELRAKTIYREALDFEPSLASYHLGLMFMKERSFEEGGPLLQRAADLGNPSAAYWLYTFNQDESDAESQRVAERYLLRAAELGHIYARRDFARRNINTSHGVVKKLCAYFELWKIKAIAVAMILMNVNDLRVR